jgi:hypothetical protein
VSPPKGRTKAERVVRALAIRGGEVVAHEEYVYEFYQANRFDPRAKPLEFFDWLATKSPGQACTEAHIKRHLQLTEGFESEDDHEPKMYSEDIEAFEDPEDTPRPYRAEEPVRPYAPLAVCDPLGREFSIADPPKPAPPKTAWERLLKKDPF